MKEFFIKQIIQKRCRGTILCEYENLFQVFDDKRVIEYNLKKLVDKTDKNVVVIYNIDQDFADTNIDGVEFIKLSNFIIKDSHDIDKNTIYLSLLEYNEVNTLYDIAEFIGSHSIHEMININLIKLANNDAPINGGLYNIIEVSDMVLSEYDGYQFIANGYIGVPKASYKLIKNRF